MPKHWSYFGIAISDISPVSIGIGDTVGSTDNSSESMRLHQTSVSSSAGGSSPMDHRVPRNEDISDSSLPSVNVRSRHDSSSSDEDSLHDSGRRPWTSPTGISSVVNSLHSHGVGDWRDDLSFHSSFGQVQSLRQGVLSDISSFRHSDEGLPRGFYHQDQQQGKNWRAFSDRNTSSISDHTDSARTDSSLSHVGVSSDENRRPFNH